MYVCTAIFCMQRNVSLLWNLRLQIANQVADALHFLHTVNKPRSVLVHGDVKRYMYIECLLWSYSTDHKQLNIYLRMLAKSLRVRIKYSRVRVHCLRAEVLHSLVRIRKL